MIRKILFILIILGVAFIIFRMINPEKADNFIDNIKNIPEKIGDMFERKNDNKKDKKDIIFTGTTLNIETEDIGNISKNEKNEKKIDKSEEEQSKKNGDLGIDDDFEDNLDKFLETGEDTKTNGDNELVDSLDSFFQDVLGEEEIDDVVNTGNEENQDLTGFDKISDEKRNEINNKDDLENENNEQNKSDEKEDNVKKEDNIEKEDNVKKEDNIEKEEENIEKKEEKEDDKEQKEEEKKEEIKYIEYEVQIVDQKATDIQKARDIFENLVE